ncbi:MAG: hypothetical protein ACUVS5_11525 [Anaerolineae bacterium]
MAIGPRAMYLSIVRAIRGVLEDPNIWSTPFHVYLEEDARNGVQPQVPYVYILTPYSAFSPPHLPVIVVSTEDRVKNTGLGELGLHTIADVHIMGRSVGEAKDLAGAIMRHILNLPVRNYDTDPGGGTIVGYAPVLPDRDGNLWTAEMVVPPEELVVEGTLAHWIALHAEFLYAY